MLQAQSDHTTGPQDGEGHSCVNLISHPSYQENLLKAEKSSMTLKMQKAQEICLIHLYMQHALGSTSIRNCIAFKARTKLGRPVGLQYKEQRESAGEPVPASRKSSLG